MSEPKKREWTVPDDLEERLSQGMYVPVDREEIQNAEIEAEIIKHRIGGVIKSAPIRVKLGARYIVVGHSYQWESFAPGMTIDLNEPVASVVDDVREESPNGVEPEPVLAD